MSLLIGLALVLVASSADAWTGQSDKTLVTVKYTEPATNTDGSPLADLKQVCAIANLDGGAEWETCWPASTLTGGQMRTQADGLTAAVLPGQKKTLNVWSVADDTAGARSIRSASAQLVLDRIAQGPGPDTQPPPAPASLTIGAPVLGPTSVNFTLTWPVVLDPPLNAPAPFYDITGGSNDGTLTFSGTATTNAFTLTTPYHASGLAAGGWLAVRPRDAAGNKALDQAAGPLTVPAKPVPPANTPAPTGVRACIFPLTATAPDTIAGWTMQLKEGTVNLGPAVPGPAPYKQTVQITQGTHQIIASWTKTGGATRVSDPGAFTCP